MPTFEIINERIQYIVDQFFKGNVSAYCRDVEIGQSTMNDILGIKKFKPSAATIAKILNGKSVKINSSWLLTGNGDMLQNDFSLTNSTGIGVPYYDIDVTASLTESFSDVKEEPEFYVDFRPFNDCTAYLPVFGDSMYPLITSGEIVALKKVINPEYIQYGEPHLIITNAEANNMRTLKIIRKHLDDDMIILKPVNPLFDEMSIPRKTILSLYIVKGKITRKQL